MSDGPESPAHDPPPPPAPGPSDGFFDAPGAPDVPDRDQPPDAEDREPL